MSARTSTKKRIRGGEDEQQKAKSASATDLVGDSQVLDGVAAHVALGQFVEAVGVLMVARVENMLRGAVGVGSSKQCRALAAPFLPFSSTGCCLTLEVSVTSRRLMFM